jgi:hypothetical protein
MYKVKYTEKFEDSYVAESNEFYYDTVHSACTGFEEITRGLLTNSEQLDGIRLYIEDYHSEDEDIDSYAIGIFVSLLREDEQIASLDLVFDPRSNTLKFESSLMIEYEYLNAVEEDQLEDLSNRL